MTMRVITDEGRTLDLGSRLDEGGEGVVYDVPGTELVAKLLIKPATANVADKLASLIQRSPSPRMARLLAGQPRRVAWPVTTVRLVSRRPAAEQVRGYLMPDMRRWYRPLNYLLRPGLRADEFPDARWDTSLAAAASLAGLVAEVHTAGYVIGDLKPENLWADETGNVGISDVDSFQFTGARGMFPCRAQTPDYAAPECIIAPDALPDSAADDFVLAVLIYQLLMDGLHPFHGIPADGTRYVSIDDNIVHGRAALVHPESVRPVPGAPPFSALPRRLRRLFACCFGEAGRAGRKERPAAIDWSGALAAERTAGRLRTCHIDPRHLYTAERPWCPWCDATRARRRPADPDA
jgi:eukaryotic-like serine/threonine-protein kinase